MAQTPNTPPAPASQTIPFPPAQHEAAKRSRLFHFGLAGTIAGGIFCVLSAAALIPYVVLGQKAAPAARGNDLTGILGWLGLAAGLIGVLLSAASLAAILINRQNKGGPQPPKPTGTKPSVPEPTQIRYSLRANINSVEVRPHAPASVYLQALRVPLEGEAVIAPEAKIQVIVPDTPAGLTAWPSNGMGSLECTFSIPTPKVCESLTVLAIAMVGEQVKARTYVHVNILPVYGLEMKWEDPQQAILQVDGKEVLAWAKVTATPPDPNAGQNLLAQRIDVSVQGPNKEWIRQPLKPFILEGKQWNSIAAVRSSVVSELQPGIPNLVANFNAGGQQLVARLPVELNQEVVLGAWVNGKKEADAIYHHKQVPSGWDFAEIVTFFHAPGNESKPSQPTFSYEFKTTPIEAEPPILEVVDFFESATIKGQYVIKVALQDGTDLETCFGETPADQRKIKVRVFAKDDKGNEYRDFVTYRVRPMVTFCVHAFEEAPMARNLQHEYRKIGFTEEMGLVANGDDSLKLAGYFMLTDKLDKDGPNPEERLDIGEVSGFAWRNLQDETDFGEPQSDEVNTRDGFLCFEIKSKQPLEAIPDRLNSVHSLILKPGLRSDIPAGYMLESEVLEVKIAMQFLRLRLWVVPGVHRHISDAVAYLDVLPAHEALTEQEVCLSTEAPMGMNLTLEECPANQDTYAQPAKDPCGPGAVRWRLRYSGISWDNMAGAEFKVHAGLEDPPDTKWRAEARIHVRENMMTLLSDLTDDATLAQEINNPDKQDLLPMLEVPSLPSDRPWDTPEDIEANLKELKKDLNYAHAWPYIVTGLPTAIRNNLYGPIYNINSWFGGEDKYVCSELRRKLMDWLEKRRFMQAQESAREVVKRLEMMNGIDFGYYAIVPAHVWAGIFPSGADRLNEHRALDPWWGQQWPDEWRRPENLLSLTGENTRGIIFKAFNYVLIYLMIKLRPELTVYQATEAIRVWLDGEPPERILEILGESQFGDWYDALKCESDNADADGKYLMGVGVEKWFQSLIKDLG